MKRLILTFGLTLAAFAVSHAQYAFPSEISSRGSRILVDGNKLSAQQAAELFTEFGGTSMGEEYLANYKGRKNGITMISVGVPMLAVGYVASVTGSLLALSPDLGNSPSAIYYTGVTIAVSGAVMTLVGIPKASIHKRRIKKTVAEYNSGISSKSVVSFAPTTSGIGIAMRF